MIIELPITGELIGENSGNPENPIKPVNLHRLIPIEQAQRCSQRVLRYDFEKETATVDVIVERGYKIVGYDKDGFVITERETDAEYNDRLTQTTASLNGLKAKSLEDIRIISKEPRLIKPIKVAEGYE